MQDAEPLKVHVGNQADVTNATLASENAAWWEQVELTQRNAQLALENQHLKEMLLAQQTRAYSGVWYPDPITGCPTATIPQCRFMLPSTMPPAAPSSPYPDAVERTSPKRSSHDQRARRNASGSFDSTDATINQDESTFTTIMLRNIPNDYSREKLLELIQLAGFLEAVDLVYLPVDFKSKVGLGYVFINLITNDDALRFREHFQGFNQWSVNSRKVSEVSWSSTYQGLHDNIERYRNSPVMHESVPDAFKPILLKAGQRIPFPKPTRKLGAPRVSSA